MSNNILIIGYYHLQDGFLACAKCLEPYYNVLFFPLLHYHDSGYDVKVELSNYINGYECEHYECGLVKREGHISNVLIWNVGYFINHPELCMYIKTHVVNKCTFISFNWDPLPPNSVITDQKKQFVLQMNLYITCDGREFKELNNGGWYNVEYSPSGFCPVMTHPMYDTSYTCDVSIVCTTLYADYTLFPKEYVRVHRKELVDLLYQHRSEITFNIYGPPAFGELYPECYKGYIPYDKCSLVFTNSKVNLCIHATSYNNNGEQLYFSERLPQILGCGGLLYCETPYVGLLRPNYNYILADQTDQWSQIYTLIKQSSKYDKIRKNGYNTGMTYYTWNTLVSKIVELTTLLRT